MVTAIHHPLLTTGHAWPKLAFLPPHGVVGYNNLEQHKTHRRHQNGLRFFLCVNFDFLWWTVRGILRGGWFPCVPVCYSRIVRLPSHNNGGRWFPLQHKESSMPSNLPAPTRALSPLAQNPSRLIESLEQLSFSIGLVAIMLEIANEKQNRQQHDTALIDDAAHTGLEFIALATPQLLALDSAKAFLESVIRQGNAAHA